MGMDFSMILGHNLSFEEIQKLDATNDLWNSLKEFYKSELNYEPINYYVKWTKEPTEKNLNEYWTKIETNGFEGETFEIKSYFGNITVFRKTIRVWFSTIFYSYKFFHDIDSTSQIIKVGRIFAKYLNTEKVLYLPDGYVKTAIIEDYATSNLTLDEAIEKGIEKFGEPPKGISKGRKNYFFVDNVSNEIGKIEDWNEEEDFWQWDETEKDYIQINKASM